MSIQFDHSVVGRATVSPERKWPVRRFPEFVCPQFTAYPQGVRHFDCNVSASIYFSGAFGLPAGLLLC
jgi:hypothetical protein